MSKHNKTCRVCMNRVAGVNGRPSQCSEFNRDVKRDRPRCSTRFLERKPRADEKVLDITE